MTITMADVDAAYGAYCKARETSVRSGWVESSAHDSAWVKFVELKEAYWRTHRRCAACGTVVKINDTWMGPIWRLNCYNDQLGGEAA